MKKTVLIIMIMVANLVNAQDGKASTVKKTFSTETTVSINIKSDPAIVWALLTNAADFPRWNSTVVSIEGDIKENEKIKLKSTLDEKRTFKIKVKLFEPNTKMIWGDSKGNRVFTITDNGSGNLTFTMTEKIGGLMYPMYAKYLPPFDESFSQYAADLKKEAELIYKSK